MSSTLAPWRQHAGRCSFTGATGATGFSSRQPDAQQGRVCAAQVSAIAPFAAFHASRINVSWQAAAGRASGEQADNEDLWSIALPDEELW